LRTYLDSYTVGSDSDSNSKLDYDLDYESTMRSDKEDSAPTIRTQMLDEWRTEVVPEKKLVREWKEGKGTTSEKADRVLNSMSLQY
jgi:hypothetical protein